ncbi:LysR family transcriptional regulator [Rhizobium sp. AB2/73]|uniref:LysR family transcriptional regulator n=1 Tax=Rhizobium sp. AB2/73 TaxID=2795216 RepID=UPI000DD76765|nr:LysR family transcriptional regulator [Rhizobium sp. AB2/73]QYA16545.1 LysR family transcriptional regulator [Rhizobium sp. AB2/73]UEQ85088.1 LysR family transcriptional regulator [Rhizobium sp. AB2/73]
MSRLMFSRFAHYLDEIANHGSIRKAAERLNVSASAINKQLISAEEEFGVALFERLPRGMRLTSAGELLVNGYREWNKDLSRIKSEIEELKGLRRGEVKIAASQETVPDFLPAVIARFTKDHPRIRNAIAVEDSDRVRQLVKDGNADFGLTFSPLPLPGVIVTRSADFHLIAMLPADPGVEQPASISIGEFFKKPTIVPDTSSHLRDVVDIAAARIDIRFQPVLTTNSLSLMRSMVREGCGFGVAAIASGMPLPHEDGLHYSRLADSGLPPMVLSLIVDPRRSLSMTSIIARRYFEEYLDEIAVRAGKASAHSLE